MPNDETAILANESTRASLGLGPDFQSRPFALEDSSVGKVRRIDEFGQANFGRAICPPQRSELQPVRGDLLCDSFVAHDSFLPPAATQGSIRLDAATMAAGAAWQSIAVFPVVHQTQLCQGALQGVAPGRRPGIRPR